MEDYLRDSDVSDLHILFRQIADDHRITVKQIAYKSGRAESTIYKYFTQEIPTIPVFIWKCLFELTLDNRIPALISGETMLIIPVNSVAKALQQDDVFKVFAKIRQKQLKLEEMAMTIIEQGTQDPSDVTVLENYNKEYLDGLVLSAQMYHYIKNAALTNNKTKAGEKQW